MTWQTKDDFSWAQRLVADFGITSEIDRSEAAELAMWLRQAVLTPAVRRSQTELTALIEVAIRRAQTRCDAAA